MICHLLTNLSAQTQTDLWPLYTLLMAKAMSV